MKVHLIIVDDDLRQVGFALDGVSEYRKSGNAGVQVSVVTPTILEAESRDELKKKAGDNAEIYSPTSLPKDAPYPFSSEPRQDMGAASRHPLPKYVASLACGLPVAILWDNQLYNDGNSDKGFTADLAIACAVQLEPGSVLRLVTSASSRGGALWPTNQVMNATEVQQKLKDAGVHLVNSDRRVAVGELLREFVLRQDGERNELVLPQDRERIVHAFAWKDKGVYLLFDKAVKKSATEKWKLVSGVEPIRRYVPGMRKGEDGEKNPEELRVFETTDIECKQLASRGRYWYLDLAKNELSGPDGRTVKIEAAEAYWLVWSALRRLKRGKPVEELYKDLKLTSGTAHYVPLNRLISRVRSILGVILIDIYVDYNVMEETELIVFGSKPG